MFANSTCFDDDLMKKTAKAVASLKEGAIVITTTDTVPSPALEVLEEVSAGGGKNARTRTIYRRHWCICVTVCTCITASANGIGVLLSSVRFLFY